jgi:hypothetical protein
MCAGGWLSVGEASNPSLTFDLVEALFNGMLDEAAVGVADRDSVPSTASPEGSPWAGQHTGRPARYPSAL